MPIVANTSVGLPLHIVRASRGPQLEPARSAKAAMSIVANTSVGLPLHIVRPQPRLATAIDQAVTSLMRAT